MGLKILVWTRLGNNARVVLVFYLVRIDRDIATLKCGVEVDLIGRGEGPVSAIGDTEVFGEVSLWEGRC
jgi:hypothetical protein